MELTYGLSHERLSGFIQRAEAPHLGRPHIRVTRESGPVEADSLSFACDLDALTHLRGGLAHPIVGQLLELHARHFDVDINPIQKRTGDALLIAGHSGRRACTLTLGVPEVSTRAGVHGAHEHEVRWKGIRAACPADRDDL